MIDFPSIFNSFIESVKKLSFRQLLFRKQLLIPGLLLLLLLLLVGILFRSFFEKRIDSLKDFVRVPVETRSQRLDEMIPEPRREFRAAWVATVNNIDWPSRPELPVAEAKNEARVILDRLVELNMNAVIFQVRPQADALYQSKLEPWSYFLTGQQGKPPRPLWDPLEFWVEEAHQRGLQIHAWFNPFRANHKSHPGEMDSKSIIKSRPELVVKLGDEGYWWMIPSEKMAREHTLNVVMDVVERYDIDGVHFDDYFYPYPSYNQNRDFPDQQSYQIYQNAGGSLDLANWRRESVNLLVREVSTRLREHQGKKVEFGISPFGIWRPGNPPGIAGMDPYTVLSADSKLWINEGWTDYMMPQLYWPIGQAGQDFSALLNWWSQQNLRQRHLWPGLLLEKAVGLEGAGEIVRQVELTRQVEQENAGVALFSMKRLRDPEWQVAHFLKSGPWSEPALIPPVPWLDDTSPKPPKVDLFVNKKGEYRVRFQPEKGEKIFQFILNERAGDRWLYPKIIPSAYQTFAVKANCTAIAFRSVDRKRNLSAPVIIEVERPEKPQ